MSVIGDKLLKGKEVKWFTIGEIANVTKLAGYEFTKYIKYQENGEIIALRGLNVKGSLDLTDVKYIDSSDFSKLERSKLVIDDMLFTYVGTIGDVALIPENDKYYLAPNVARIRFNDANHIMPKFMFYYFQTNIFTSKQVNKYLSSSSMKNLTMESIRKFEVPIPPLFVQAEIVRILDAFTVMTAELTAELSTRKKQYNYYRDQLFGFENGEVEWKTLGELAENLDSKRKPITSGLRDAGDIPYYGASGIVDYVKDYIFDGDFLLISEDGANLLARNTPIAFSISGKTWVNNHAHVLKFNTYAERRYVEYYLNSIDLTPYISGAAQPKLNKKNLESISIPSPSFEEKERIVLMLDKFDALINSLTEGLPREIDLRQKQYEYYRDLLLSFPKPFSEVVV